MSQQVSLFRDDDAEEKDTVVLSVNGRARNNNHTKSPQKAAMGYIIDDGDKSIAKSSEFLGQGEKYSSNYADYRAVISGIREAKQQRSADEVSLEIKCNNEVVVEQLDGPADAVKMEKQHRTCMEEVHKFASWRAEYVPKEESDRIQQADTLAENAFDL